MYSGDDSMTLPLLAGGAVGVVGVATHWTGPDHQEMLELWDKGDLIGARLVHSRMLPSFAYETGDDAPNPIPTKALLRVLGLPVGQARLPMGPAPAGLEDRARDVLADLERWRERSRTVPTACLPDRWRLRSASPSSAASGRSVATAWSSSRTGAGCSSTAG